MERIFTQTGICKDLESQVLNFLTQQSEDEYWQNVYKEIFSKKVVAKLDPKGYFSKKVLPEIDQGWLLVGIGGFVFCETCLPDRIIHSDCCNCAMEMPCANCYFYDGMCNCSGNLQFVSYKTMHAFIPELVHYPNYISFRKANTFDMF
jgi:hypothetical protein